MDQYLVARQGVTYQILYATALLIIVAPRFALRPGQLFAETQYRRIARPRAKKSHAAVSFQGLRMPLPG